MTDIGFTGTSKGMTLSQKAEVRRKLICFKAEGATRFHHGLCIGGDEQAAQIAKELGYYVIAHPGYSPRNPTNTLYRSDFNDNDEVRPEKPFIVRDKDIVDETDRLIGAPLTKEEQVRSGTWTTLRYAKKKGKIRDIIDP
jgi:hypothetical protein